MRYSALLCSLALAACAVTVSSGQNTYPEQGGDPPARVGRLSDLRGLVSLYPAGAGDWTDGSINYPLTTGDALWADDTSRAEIQLGGSAIRIGAGTSIVFGEVSDSVTQLRIDQGMLEVSILALNQGDIYEIDTPSGVVSLLSVGRYRIDVTPDGRRSSVTVRSGGAMIDYDDGSYSVAAGTTATLLAAGRRPVAGGALPVDELEQWANARDRDAGDAEAARYLSTDVVGYQDLDRYGIWQGDPSYGEVWYPRGVPADWAPYRFGHWESVAPWGWTWIDDAPWGFAPFHYGRWAYINRRWGWVPGYATRYRPVYAPALVAFIGGENWNVRATFGGGPAVGWVPLAPGEPYVPGYTASPGYQRRINLTGGREAPGRGGNDGMRYANRDAPGGVTAIGQDDFLHARPVGRNAVPVRPNEVEGARPSPVPLAGGVRITPTPRGQRGDNRNRTGRDVGRQPPPPTTPPPPPRARPRPRPGGEPTGGGGAPPVAAPTGRPDRPVQPPTTPPVNPPPADRPPVNPNPANPSPPTGQDRGRPRPVTPPPPPQGGNPVQPPPTPPVNPPPPDRPQPEARPRPDVRPQPPAGQNADAWQKRMGQLTARHQQEDADLAKRQGQAQQHMPKGLTPAQLQQIQAAERKAQADRHQRERDALLRQKPAG